MQLKGKISFVLSINPDDKEMREYFNLLSVSKKSALSEGQYDCPSYFIRGTFFPEPFAIAQNFRFIDSLKRAF